MRDNVERLETRLLLIAASRDTVHEFSRLQSAMSAIVPGLTDEACDAPSAGTTATHQE
jgi:hypothetical protein